MKYVWRTPPDTLLTFPVYDLLLCRATGRVPD